MWWPPIPSPHYAPVLLDSPRCSPRDAGRTARPPALAFASLAAVESSPTCAAEPPVSRRRGHRSPKPAIPGSSPGCPHAHPVCTGTSSRRLTRRRRATRRLPPVRIPVAPRLPRVCRRSSPVDTARRASDLAPRKTADQYPPRVKCRGVVRPRAVRGARQPTRAPTDPPLGEELRARAVGAWSDRPAARAPQSPLCGGNRLANSRGMPTQSTRHPLG